MKRRILTLGLTLLLLTATVGCWHNRCGTVRTSARPCCPPTTTGLYPRRPISIGNSAAIDQPPPGAVIVPAR